MAERIHLELVTPTRIVAQSEVLDVTAPGIQGEFGVLPGHTVFVSLLKPGEVRFREDDKVRYFAVGRGFAEVGPERVVILADSAEESSALSADEIRASILQDEAMLKSLPAGDPEGAILMDRLERNQARLAAATRH